MAKQTMTNNFFNSPFTKSPQFSKFLMSSSFIWKLSGSGISSLTEKQKLKKNFLRNVLKTFVLCNIKTKLSYILSEKKHNYHLKEFNYVIRRSDIQFSESSVFKKMNPRRPMTYLN